MTRRQNALRRALKRFDETIGGKPWYKIDWNRAVLLATQIAAAESRVKAAESSSRGSEGSSGSAGNIAILNTWECVDRFLGIYPLGFNDPEYRSREREPKDEAREEFSQVLSQDEIRRVVGTGNFKEVATRALRVASSMDLIPRDDLVSMENGLRTQKARCRFASALDSLLYGRDLERKRFEDWSGLLREIGALTWPVAGCFQFLVHPEGRIFIEPQVIQDAARSLGAELTCPAEVVWETYSRIQRFAEAIRKEIRELGPRDMIDVQAFLRYIAQGG